LQLVRAGLPTERKLALARTLLGAGLPQLEIGAIVRPDRLPTMADTERVIAGMGAAGALDECWVLVPNLTGTRRAIAAGARNLQYVLSVSESHNLANMGCSVRRSLDGLVESLEYDADYDATIQLGLATAFTCPFEGRTPVDAVRRVIGEGSVRAVHRVVRQQPAGGRAVRDAPGVADARVVPPPGPGRSRAHQRARRTRAQPGRRGCSAFPGRGTLGTR
jgi:hydroxymethylglutaryl-CoA lyase